MSEQPQVSRIPQFTVGDRLRKARELTRLDQAQFASEIGVSRATVSTYESGADVTRKPIVLRAWAVRTGVPLSWIETGIDPTQQGPRPGGSQDEGRKRAPSGTRTPNPLICVLRGWEPAQTNVIPLELERLAPAATWDRAA